MFGIIPWGSPRERERSSILSLQDNVNRMFDRLFATAFEPEPFAGTADWAPRVDVAENDEAFIVRAEVPGVDPKDIEITLEGDVLTIRGEKAEETKREEACWHRVERRYGAFARSIRLDAPVVADRVTADARNGVFTITCPKAEEAKSRKVKVTVGESGE